MLTCCTPPLLHGPPRTTQRRARERLTWFCVRLRAAFFPRRNYEQKLSEFDEKVKSINFGEVVSGLVRVPMHTIFDVH
jgi:hypothetical protein